MRNRHRWKKRNFSKTPVYHHEDTNIYSRIYNTYECVHCGLRKGHSKDYLFSTLVFFVPDKVLSKDRIPFPCHGEWIGGSLPINKNRVVFICEDEFKV